MADLIISKFPDCKIYASKRWHLSPLENVKHIISNITFIDCDLTDPLSTSDLIRLSKPEVIFHFAAESFVSPSWKNPSRYMEVNYNGTINLLEAIRKYAPECIIHIPGSGEEYGDICEKDLPINLKTVINPVNPYAVSKVAQDLIAKVYYDSYGLNVVRTRAFNHEGPRRSYVFGLPWYAYQISKIKAGLQEKKMVTGHRFDKRNFTHVIDMCKAYLLAVQSCQFGELYLVGNSDVKYETTFDEALNYMLKKSGLESQVKVNTVEQYMRPTQVPFLISDCSKFTDETGWKPEKTLEDIMDETLGYWENHSMLGCNLNVIGSVHPLK